MAIDTLFLDIGGVLLTNGWDHGMRQEAARTFSFDYAEYEEHHQLVYSTHELGHISLDEYLKFSLFFKKRPFSKEKFKDFMYAQSKPLPDMIPYLQEIKEQYGLRLVAVSNEGKELTCHRIDHCGLKEVLDFFVISSYVHFRKPDFSIYQMALNMVQRKPEDVIYIDDRQALVQAGNYLGLRSIQNISFQKTKEEIEQLLSLPVMPKV